MIFEDMLLYGVSSCKGGLSMQGFTKTFVCLASVGYHLIYSIPC